MSKSALKGAVVLVTLALCIPGCSNQSEGNSAQFVTRTKLIGDLESYMSWEEAKMRLKPKLTWEVVEESKLDPVESQTEHFLAVSVKDFSHIGFSGRLVLQFFNGQLMATLFYPDDFRHYVEALLKAEKFRIDPNRYARTETRVHPYTRVEIVNADKMEMASDIDLSYVVWADERLSKEYFNALLKIEERRKKRWESR